MLNDIFGLGKKRKPGMPSRESHSKVVSAERFNEMIAYYTGELKSRLDEIKRLKEENEMLIKTSLKNASRADESNLHVKKLQEEVRVLKEQSATKRQD